MVKEKERREKKVLNVYYISSVPSWTFFHIKYFIFLPLILFYYLSLLCLYPAFLCLFLVSLIYLHFFQVCFVDSLFVVYLSAFNNTTIYHLCFSTFVSHVESFFPWLFCLVFFFFRRHYFHLHLLSINLINFLLLWTFSSFFVFWSFSSFHLSLLVFIFLFLSFFLFFQSSLLFLKCLTFFFWSNDPCMCLFPLYCAKCLLGQESELILWNIIIEQYN